MKEKLPSRSRPIVLTRAYGLGAGLAAVAFQLGMKALYRARIVRLSQASTPIFLLGSLVVIVATSLAVGFLLTRFAPEASGSGIPQLKAAFLAGVGSGYFLFAVVSRYIFHICPACAASRFDEATTHRLAEFALGMMIALAIHFAVDGLALAVGHEESEAVDLSVTFAICAHKFPEGLALGALLLGGGFKRRGMLWLVAAVECTTALGGLLGWLILQNVSKVWLALALANAGGGLLYLAAHAVLGEIFKHHKALVLGSFATGFGAIAALILYFHLRA